MTPTELRKVCFDALGSPSLRLLPARVGRLRESPINRPLAKAPVHRRLVNAQAPRPLCAREGFAPELNATRARAVVVLFDAGGPPAVVRRVPAIVVDSFNREPVRHVAHIGMKGPRVMPPVAHRNAAPAVPMISMEVRVVAAVHHSGPNAVPRVLAEAVDRGGLAKRFSRDLSSQAATRLREAKHKMLIRLHRCLPAVARALPSRLAAKVPDTTRRHKHVEALAGDVGEVVCSHIKSLVSPV